MTYPQTIILAIIEGLTEFLPISSTGHLILAQKFLGISTSEFTKSFNIIIQFSAILAVVMLFWKKIISSSYLWKQIIIAFIPTGILGLVLYKIVKGYLLDSPLLIAASLFIGGIALLIIDHLTFLRKNSKSIKSLKTTNLVSIGLFQSLSMIPGVSRSAASIVGGMFSGLSKAKAVEFSFLLAIPTMTATTGYDLFKNGLTFTPRELSLILLGSIISFFSAYLAIKMFVSYVSKHNFSIFAYYRIILAIVIWVSLKS
jgi:undecaprenyl-diphosphatase